MHKDEVRGNAGHHPNCFILAHNEQCFGLRKNDATMLGKREREWQPPTKQAIDHNAAHIKRLRTIEKETSWR